MSRSRGSRQGGRSQWPDSFLLFEFIGDARGAGAPDAIEELRRVVRIQGQRIARLEAGRLAAPRAKGSATARRSSRPN